jgi:hypothetical protein
MHLRVLTNSELKTLRRCPREHFLAYEQGVRPVDEAEALRFGSLMHRGLEAWWLAVQSGADRLDAAMAALVNAVDPFEEARAREMLIGYNARWYDEPLDVIAVEKEFRAPLVNPETGAPSRTFQLGGKLDVIVIDRRDGRVYKVEHKSSSEDIGVGSNYWKRLTLDPQISTYYAGARELGYDVAGCIYDVLAKPGQRPSQVPLRDENNEKIVLDANGSRVRTKNGKKYRETADADLGYVLQTRPETPDEYAERIRAAIVENPDKFYQRGTVVRLETEERDAAFDRWQISRMLREAQLSNRWPRNPDGCVRYGRTCSYFGVCTGTEDIDDPTLFRRTTNVHEELTQDYAADAAE